MDFVKDQPLTVNIFDLEDSINRKYILCSSECLLSSAGKTL